MSAARLASRMLLALGAVLLVVCLWATFVTPERGRLAGKLSIATGVTVVAAALLQIASRKEA